MNPMMRLMIGHAFVMNQSTTARITFCMPCQAPSTNLRNQSNFLYATTRSATRPTMARMMSTIGLTAITALKMPITIVHALKPAMMGTSTPARTTTMSLLSFSHPTTFATTGMTFSDMNVTSAEMAGIR